MPFSNSAFLGLSSIDSEGLLLQTLSAAMDGLQFPEASCFTPFAPAMLVSGNILEREQFRMEEGEINGEDVSSAIQTVTNTSEIIK